MKVYTVAVIGCGSRGHDAFGLNLMRKGDKKFRIVALCDKVRERADRCAREFGVSPENVFYDEESFFREKRADSVVIATQDRDHVRMALKALALGYAILMEKPISPVGEELLRLLEAHKKYPRPVTPIFLYLYPLSFRPTRSGTRAAGEMRKVRDCALLLASPFGAPEGRALCRSTRAKRGGKGLRTLSPSPSLSDRNPSFLSSDCIKTLKNSAICRKKPKKFA